MAGLGFLPRDRVEPEVIQVRPGKHELRPPQDAPLPCWCPDRGARIAPDDFAVGTKEPGSGAG